MATLEIPKGAVTRFDLPAVCLVTGSPEGVTYRATTFTFVPLWARVSLVFCGLIGAVLMVISMRRVKAELPFTDGAWRAWRRAQAITVGLILAAIAVLLVPLLIAPSSILPAAVGFVAMLVAAVTYAALVGKKAGPVCKSIDDHTIVLEVPSQEAARAIEERLGLGAPATEAVTATADRYDARLQAELDAL